MEHAALLSRDSIACVNKRNLEDIVTTANENNVRLRKKLDLIKHEKEKVCVCIDMLPRSVADVKCINI